VSRYFKKFVHQWLKPTIHTKKYVYQNGRKRVRKKSKEESETRIRRRDTGDGMMEEGRKDGNTTKHRAGSCHSNRPVSQKSYGLQKHDLTFGTFKSFYTPKPSPSFPAP
jgi:hypothetical protein